MKEIRVLSLFSGGGGLDIGFHKAGFKIVACIEIDKPSCDTLELNKGRYIDQECHIINADITELSPSSLDIGQIDFIIGGPPCQSFSAAGRRAGGVTGVNDKRGSLFWYYCKFLEKFQPQGFLFENVRGILQANNSKDWDIIKESFSGLGYNLNYRILDAADYGVPQHRERVILVGTKRKPFLFPRPTHGTDSVDLRPHLTVGEAFKDIDDPNEIVPPYGGKYGDLLPDIPPGMNYLFYTEKMGHLSPRFAWRSMFSGFLYKLAPHSVSKTLVANQGKYDGPFHWKNRKLNLAEIKRVQAFPDDYIFIKSKVAALKQIGNAVAPRFAEVLAKAVSNQLFEGKHPDIEYIDNNLTLSFDSKKGAKAKITRSQVAKNEKKMQLSLFESKNLKHKAINIDDLLVDYRFSDRKFKRSMNLVKGHWKIILELQDAELVKKVELTLKFNPPVNNIFSSIDATIATDSIRDINWLWDSIHHCISLSSSYGSLQPLYGHFTEPYPKFNLKTEVFCDTNAPFSLFIKNLCDFSYLSKVHSFADLAELTGSGDVMNFIKDLRASGYDIRVHETNRAIPQGFFKVCYPFTLYGKENFYTVWQEKGDHKTGDIKMAMTANGYQPIEFKR